MLKALGGERTIGMIETEYGGESVKELNAGMTELRILLSQPKLMASPYYRTLETTDSSLKLTDSMGSAKYSLEVLETPGSGPLRYNFEMDMDRQYVKRSEITVFLERIDDIRTRMRIEARRTDFRFADDMAKTIHYLPEATVASFKSVMMELQVFQSLIDGAIQSNLPYIRDAIIVKGDYVGAKIDIKDSVLQRAEIKVDGRPPPDVHVRADTHVSHKVEIKDSVVQRSGIGSGGKGDVKVDGSVVTRSDLGGQAEVKDGVVVGKRDKVGGAAECLGDPNLEIYRKALEQAMSDGIIVDSEDSMLMVLRKQLGVTPERHDMLLAEIQKSSNKNLQTYRQLLAEAVRDGKIDADEEGMLESMRQGLGITTEQHELLLRELTRKDR